MDLEECFVLGRYHSSRSIYNVLTETKVLNFYIIYVNKDIFKASMKHNKNTGPESVGFNSVHREILSTSTIVPYDKVRGQNKTQ